MPGSTVSASSDGPLLVVGVNWIGDAIMTMPGLQAWRRAHPRRRLLLLTKSALAPLWGLHRSADEILTYDNPWPAMRAAVSAIARCGATRAVILPNSFRSALLPFLARVPERIGRRGHGRRPLLTRVIPDPEPGHQALETYDLLDMPRPAEGPERPKIDVPQAEVETAARRVGRLPRPLLGVMPGAARGPAKRWPSLHFARVASRWAAERGGLIVLGGPGDRAAGDAILESIEGGLNLAGQTSIPEWAALLAVCDAVVCNDSGGMHLAAALGRPVVAVFGATDPNVTGPLGERARVVTDGGPQSRAIARADDEAEKRLAAISPDLVYAALLEIAA